MKIFKESGNENKNVKGKSTTSATKVGGRNKAPKPARKDIGAAEIREKLAARVETSDVAKNMAIKNSKKLGEGFLNDEIKAVPVVLKKSEEVETPNTKDFVLNSDIATNDPTDSNTQEKLKTVLSKGAFNFNPKERDALEKILANQ